MRRSKLGNKAIIIDGQRFDSKAEARRYSQLRLLEKAGEVSDIRCQVMYELIPGHYEYVPTGKIFSRGARKGQKEYKRVTVELPVTYRADFVYKDKDGNTVVEDVKGYTDPKSATYAKFVIKRKLMLWIHGVKVKEVKV